MSDTSSILSLPFIQPSQAQKHVTHNEAINMLDALVQTAVRSRSIETPPETPVAGDIYVVGAQAVGDWTGQQDAVAVFTNTWVFYAPHAGWRVWVEDAETLSVYNGTSWIDIAGETVSELPVLGINAMASLPDRLSVSASATLLNHEGAGHQLKLNKAAVAETASLLFQSDFSGRAEMGLAGEDDFSVKVSADGTNWTTAMRFDAASGLASGAAVQADAADVTPGRLMRADYGYGPGNVVGPVSQAAGLPTGAVVESGTTSNGSYVRFADGTQVCTFVTPEMMADYYPLGNSGLWGANSVAWDYPVPFVENPIVTLTAQRVSGVHAHSATIGSGGYGETSVRIFMIAMENSRGVVHAQATGRWF